VRSGAALRLEAIGRKNKKRKKVKISIPPMPDLNSSLFFKKTFSNTHLQNTSL